LVFRLSRQGAGFSILTAGFVAALRAICGFAGGVLGRIVSDWLLRRGKSVAQDTNRHRLLVQGTGNFSLALVFVAANAVVAVLSYLVVVGEIKRVAVT